MKPYFWLGREADDSPEVIDALECPVPLVVIDTSEIEDE